MANNVKFHYKYSGNGWASGHISIGSNKFEFACSYVLSHPLEELMSAVYQIIPNLAPFPRKKIDFILWEEPTEFRWELHMIDEKTWSSTYMNWSLIRKKNLFSKTISILTIY